MVRKKKIVYSDYARKEYKVGGGQIYLRNMLSYLNRSKFIPVVYSLSDVSIFSDVVDCHLYEYSSKRKSVDMIKSDCLSKTFDFHVLKDVCSWFSGAIRQTRRVLKKENPDIIHLNGLIPLIVTVFSFPKRNCKLVYHVHHTPKKFLAKCILNLFSLFTSYDICISHYIKESVFFLQRRKHVVIYNGTSLPSRLNEYRDRENTICMLGNFIPWKGHRELVSVIEIEANLLRKYEYKVYFYGHGEQEEQIKKLVKMKKLDDIIKFPGFTRDIERVLQSSRILLHCSVEPEPFGLVLIEGMANGNVVIASNLGAAHEIISNNIDGYLVNPRDKEAYSKILAYVIQHVDELDDIRKRAFSKVSKHFNLINNIKEIESLYDKVLEER